MVWLFALAVLAPAVQKDSVRVSATLKTDRIVAGESTVLEIRVETSGVVPDAIRMPDLPAGLDLIGQSDVTYDQINFPGGRTRLTSRSIILTARVPGTFMVPGVSIVVAGRTYRTPPVPLVVYSAPHSRASPNLEARVELNATVEPRTAWVGQQITFSAEAVFPRELRQRQTRPATYQAPNPSGFWAQDLADPTVIGLRSEGDDIYETQTFRRAYFPITAGRHVFPPARLGYEYRPGAGLPPESREVLSDSIRINVRPLPEAGRPASFSGAVGQYRVRASLEPLQADVGEAVSLEVEVIGRGNIKALPPPVLPDLPGIEVFPPTEDAEPQVGPDFVSGTKRFSWVLVPREPGDIDIPAIEYAYFDPEAGRYEVAQSAPLRLEVSGAPIPDDGQVALRPIKPLPATALGFTRSRVFLAAQAVPLLLLLASVVAARAKAATTAHPRPASTRSALAHLRGAVGGDARAFSDQLARAIRAHAAELCAQPALRTASSTALSEALQAAGTPRPTAAALGDLVAALDRVRFTRDEPPPDPAASLARAQHLLDAVAAALARGHAGRAAPVVALALAGAAATSAHASLAGRHAQAAAVPVAALAAQASADDGFRRGVQLLLRSRPDAAAAELERYLDANNRDSNGWYNLGNAHYQAGRAGEAVRAWMRAVRILPRHREARANLAAVAPAALPLLPSAVALSREEAVLLLAVIWWGFAGWTAWRLRQRRRPGWAAAGLAVAALLVALGGLAGRSPADLAVTTVATTVLMDPVLKADAVEELPPATPVTVRARRPGWLLVRTPAGREGWIDEATLTGV